MKLLLAAATEGEISLLTHHLKEHWQAIQPAVFRHNDLDLHICITGVGMMATTYSLTKALQQPYNFALQAGVGGSFNKAISLGDVVHITSETLGDLGAEDHNDYLDIFELNLLQKDTHPFTEGNLIASQSPIAGKIALPKAKGLTINTVSGSLPTIERRAEKYNCDVESMEGSAFHYVCLQEKIPFAQVRSISNYVMPRDKSSWQMKDAIINLNKWLIDFLESL